MIFSFIKHLIFLFIILATSACSFSLRQDFSILSLHGAINFSIIFAAYVVTMITIENFNHFPGNRSTISIIPTVIICFTTVFFIISLFDIPYFLPFWVIGTMMTFIMCYVDFFIRRRKKQVMAFIPLGKGKDVESIPGVCWIRLDNARLPERRIHAIVADLHSPSLTDEWQRFLAQKTLQGIAVFNVRQVEESLTGRVKIHHMYENDLGSLSPSAIYSCIKITMDILLVLLFLPLILLVMLVVAIFIKLDDGGPVFFVQDRIGHRGKIFKVYKFRSMKDQAQIQFTQLNDQRITKVGHFIRKTRLDEFPQFFNVLKGEMSLIGPRAEYKVFADELEKEVPFYQYRHIVRPGISGWAQVMQGYATGPAETQIKVEHDFYYIKHYSFSLDVLIFFKTIKIMFTGYGAR